MEGNIILKLHGCSGAGKTTVARAIFSNSLAVQVISNKVRPDKHEAYGCELKGFDRPLFILGSYQNNCGGMDTVPDQATAMDMINFYAEQGHVFHEGLLQSTYYGKMGEDSKKYGDNYVYGFLDTPLQTCLDRITFRRSEQGSTNKFNPQLTIDKWNTINRLKNRCKVMGHNVVTFSHEIDAIPQLYSIYLKVGQ